MPVIAAPPPIATQTRSGLVSSGVQTLAGNKTLVGTLTVNGLVHATVDGVKFPDGTTQTTAFVGGSVIGGSGQVGQVPFFTNVGTVGGSDQLFWDAEYQGLIIGETITDDL